MPTLEGKLLRSWREYRGLTQGELAKLARVKGGKNRIGNIETLDNSASVRTLIPIVKALKLPGATPALQLALFFFGPERTALEDAIETAEANERLNRELSRQLRTLAGHGQRPPGSPQEPAD